MRRSPSLVPEAVNQDIYLVLDDFGALGRRWRETDEAEIDRETVIISLLEASIESGSRSCLQHRRRLVARRIGRSGR